MWSLCPHKATAAAGRSEVCFFLASETAGESEGGEKLAPPNLVRRSGGGR